MLIQNEERQERALKALKLIGDAIVQTCKQSPLGAPGGILYAALMSYGITLEQFEGIMSGLCKAGLLRKSGDCYHAV